MGIQPILSVHLGSLNGTGSLCTTAADDATPVPEHHDSGAWNQTSDPAGFVEFLFADAKSVRNFD